MKPENRTLVVPIVCFAVILVVAVASVYAISAIPPLPSALPLPAGTVIRSSYLEVSFVVEGGPANLVGAWYAEEGGLFWVVQANMSSGPITPLCGSPPPWNGTVNVTLLPGVWLVGFAPNPYGTIVITEAIALAYPGSSQVIGGQVQGWGCTPPGVRPPPGAGA